MKSEIPTPAAVINNAARLRASHYRQQAARFRSMAEFEPTPKLRQRLSCLAVRYEKLADSAELPANAEA